MDLIDLAEEIALLMKDDGKSSRKSRYSITGDIISYQKCPRQYCFLKIKGFRPSNRLQLWYGHALHQSIKRLVSFFNETGRIPDDTDVRYCFNHVVKSLRKAGLEPDSEDKKDGALQVLLLFNEREGESFYSKVVATEMSLEKDLGDFIVFGVIDALLRNDCNISDENYSPVEIWDYKGQLIKSADLIKYKEQIFLYAYLYYLKTGFLPVRGVIYFLNELKGNTSRARYTIDFTEEENLDFLHISIEKFKRIAAEIDRKRRDCYSRFLTDIWKPPENPDVAMCSVCDFRWDCPAVSGRFSLWELP